MTTALLLLFYLGTPIVVLHLCHRYRFVNKLGAVVITYIIGLLAGNLKFLPPGTEVIQDALTSATIPLALPLLLFSLNIKTWLKMAGKTILSLVLGIFSAIIMVMVGYYIFRDILPEIWKVSGMMVGVYSGGTPNMASIQSVVQAKPETYIILNTHDIILSSIYLAFLMTVGQKIFGLVLKPFKGDKKLDDKNIGFDGKDPYWGIFRKKIFFPVLTATGISVLIAGISIALSFLIAGEISMLVIILSITTLGIAVSLIPRVNKIEKTFETGMYFILVFSLAVASMADISQFAGSAPGLFFYVALVIFGSLILHLALSKIFNIDTDTMIITSTALICSPPFVPVVAGALKNKEVIISGLTVGIIGYAIGNYLGISIAFLLR
ncbi:MAG: DUF819 family protein [Bacteroidetes bacterium]|nr:MAG: DUF819 family protein [Bacteroidota bacterium]